MVSDLRKKERVIVLPCGMRSVRFRPALSVSEDELDEAVAAVGRAARRLAQEVA
jgi:L-lysine 6-transaminase